MTKDELLNGIFVIDGLFEKKLIEDFRNFLFYGNKISWSLGDSTSPTEETIERQDGNVFEYFQFVHSIIMDGKVVSDMIQYIDPLVRRIQSFLAINKDLEFSRIKINFQQKVITDKLYNTPHVDIPNSHHVFILYLNDSDGPTYVFENDQKPWKIEKTIQPKEGRLVLFPGNLYHAGMHPKENDCRIAVNFNCLNLKECVDEVKV